MTAPATTAERTPDELPRRGDRKAVEQRLADRRTEPWRPSDTPLVWIALATGLGGAGFPALASAHLEPSGAAMLAVVTLCGWLVAWCKKRDRLACQLLLASIALLAAGWGGASWHHFAVSEIGRYAPRDAEPVALEVTVSTMPVVYPATTRRRSVRSPRRTERLSRPR